MKLTVSLAPLLPILFCCQHELFHPAPVELPAQRPAAQTVSYLGLSADQIELTKVSIGNGTYSVNAIDSTSFRYDQQQRLVSRLLNQTYQAYEKVVKGPGLQSDYTYEDNVLAGHEGYYGGWEGTNAVYPLDTQHQHVLSHTKRSTSSVDLDTLRQYSSEGILTNVQRTSYRDVMTIENGNVVKKERYSIYSDQLIEVTAFLYDSQHLAPLSALTFLGENSRNVLTQKTVTTYLPDGSQTDVYTYYNEYDGQDRLTRQTEFGKPLDKSANVPRTLTTYYY